MRYLVFSMMLLTAVPASAQDGEVFARIGGALNREIALVESDGTVRRGVLEKVTADEASVRFAAGVRTFSRQNILTIERMRDGILDGAIRGAIVGGLLGLATLGYPEGTARAGIWMCSIVAYSGIGLALDAAQTHREMLYRSPRGASMSLSFRF